MTGKKTGLLKRFVQDFYLVLILVFLFSLIATMAVLSFNSSKSRTQWGGFTTRWYTELFSSSTIMTALYNTLLIAFLSSIIAVIIGTAAAIAINNMKRVPRNIPYVILSVMPKLKQTDKSTYEAAMDLGATPVYAFFKVVFPDILPGVLSGFLLAFTMSLDDFIITHFTRGAGINTLSTLIYSEVRRGIKPSMYALSTIIFLTVLILLLITNFAPKRKKH